MEEVNKIYVLDNLLKINLYDRIQVMYFDLNIYFLVLNLIFLKFYLLFKINI